MSEGRWPANVILSPDMAGVLDQQSGVSKSAANGARQTATRAQDGRGRADGYRMGSAGEKVSHGDAGGASRFFLNAGYEPWELEWIYQNGLRPCGAEEQ